MEEEPVYSVLFVCLGNICRSPTAEALMRRLVDDTGLTEAIAVDSAGTGNYHVGERPDRRMREAAAERGVNLRGRARQIIPSDFERFDLVVAMDRSNLRDLRRLAGNRRDRVQLLSDFLPDGHPVDVPDPYYQGRFDQVIDILDQACPQILKRFMGER